MIKCVVFDVDGTLIDTGDAIIASLQKVLSEELGREYPREELYFSFGIPGEVTLKAFGINEVEGPLGKWLRYLDEFGNTIRIFEGIESCLQELKARDIKLGIVTSKSRGEYESGFVPMGLGDYFDYVVCADDTERHKPHPEPILKLLELSGGKPGEIVFVGDTKYDKACAAGAGVKFGLALWGAKSAEGIEPDYILNDPVEILEIIS